VELCKRYANNKQLINLMELCKRYANNKQLMNLLESKHAKNMQIISN